MTNNRISTSGCIKILSWNINDSRSCSEGPKIEDTDFIKILNDHDLICLQETKAPLTLPNFTCFNSNRPDSRPGGVCIGIKKSLMKGVSKLKTKYNADDIIGVTLRASYFNLPQDIVILNVYSSPDNSSYNIRKKADTKNEFVSTLDALSEIILDIPSSKNIFLAGDFNARSGTMNDINTRSHHHGNNDHEWDTEYPANIPKRSNKDPVINGKGKSFIELVKSAGLIILNGRTVGDILGDHTCYKYNGCSAIDYMCVSSNLYEKINYFRVHHLNIYSDHTPISAAIGTCGKVMATKLNLDDFDDAPKRFLWTAGDPKDSNSSAYKMKFAQLCPDVSQRIQLLSNTPVSSKDDAIKLNNDITSILLDLAIIAAPKRHSKRTNKKKWFDWDCRASKRKLSKLSKMYSKHPFNVDARSAYYSAKKSYKQLIKTKKKDFFVALNEKVNKDKSLDWKAFKRLKEEQGDQETFDLYDLQNFYSFFKELYSRSCSISSNQHQNDIYHHRKMDNDIDTSANGASEALASLNSDFNEDELNHCIKNLKNNKSTSDDLISNEILKNASNNTVPALLYSSYLTAA